MSENGDQNPYGEPTAGGQGNNPDPYGDAPHSNPYGGVPLSKKTADPAGAQSNPYGAPQPNPYGAPQPAPGGFPGYGATPAAPAKTDGLSIGALIASVIGLCTCVGSIVGIVLGIIGLSRTKEGRARGRGFAIAGIVIGGIGILLWIIGVVVVAVIGVNQIVTPSNAKAGQCVNLDESNDKVSMTKSSCTDDHDAEIVGVGKVTSDNIDTASKVGFCTTLIDPADLARLNDQPGLKLSSVTENPDDMKVGDHIVCYVEKTSGQLSEDLLH